MRDTIIRYLRHLPRALLFSAVFFGIPLGLLFLGGQQWYEEKAHRMQRLLVQDLDNYLATWRTEHPFLTHLEYTLRKYGNLALSAPDTRTALKSFIHQMQKRFPDTLHFLCLDNRGNVLPDLSEFQPNHTLIQRFYQDYTLLEANLPGPMTRHVHQYRDFLGPMIGRDKEIKIYNKMLIASQREKRSYVYLSPATAAGMFLVFIDRHSKFDQICLTDLARTHSRVCSPWIVQLYDLKNPTAPANTLPPNLQVSADAMLGLLESGSQPQLFAHGYLWHAMTHLGTFRLLIGVPDHSHLYLLEHLEVLKIAVGCVFSLLFLAVLVLFSQPTPISFSIRGKLTLLFLYLVG
ncbi:MAG TPA: hypothetical protein PKO06_04320, partial [Candidatus Ozemobacteraceae bacterium]|nr:hypothetical protein [Candidatus Ozemobacteraceae bacterium]